MYPGQVGLYHKIGALQNRGDLIKEFNQGSLIVQPRGRALVQREMEISISKPSPSGECGNSFLVGPCYWDLEMTYGNSKSWEIKAICVLHQHPHPPRCHTRGQLLLINPDFVIGQLQPPTQYSRLNLFFLNVSCPFSPRVYLCDCIGCYGYVFFCVITISKFSGFK